MNAKRQPHKNIGWNAIGMERSSATVVPAIRAESPPWIRTAPLIIGMSALLWDVVLDLVHWLAALQI